MTAALTPSAFNVEAPSSSMSVSLLVWEVVTWPFRALYLHGPAVRVFGADIGFWEGWAQEDICASITGIQAHLWTAGRDLDGRCGGTVPIGVLPSEVPCAQCAEKIAHKADAFAVVCLFLLVAYTAYHAFHMFLIRRMMLGPLVEAIRRRTPPPLLRLLSPGGRTHTAASLPQRLTPPPPFHATDDKTD